MALRYRQNGDMTNSGSTPIWAMQCNAQIEDALI